VTVKESEEKLPPVAGSTSPRSDQAPAKPEGLSQPWVSYLMTAGLYIIGYVALDRISFLHPFSEIGITPWDPPAGLTLALLLRFGLGFAPVVPIAVILAEILVRRLAAPWLPAMPTLISVAITAGGYIAAAAILIRGFGIDPGLRRLYDVLRFVGVGVAAALFIAYAVVGNYVAFGMIAPGDFWAAVLQSWIGDFIGILTLAPALLVFSDTQLGTRLDERRRGSAGLVLEALLQAGSIVGTVWFVFGLDFPDELKLFYLLFLPTMWIAVRYGLAGAAAAILATQITLKIAFQARGFGAPTVIDFQMLMVALGLTGLFVGAIVSERRQASHALKESEGRVKAILQTAPDAILTLDERGSIKSVNPAAEQMFAGTWAHLEDRSVSQLLPDLDPGGEHTLRELSGRRCDGTSFPSEVAVGQTVIGNRPHFIAIVRDVTRRVQAEALVRQHQVELAHVDRVSIVGEMASAIAHEESQPLAAIAAYTRACRLLLRGPEIDRAKVTEALDKMAAQTARAGDILNRLREFLHRGEIEANPTSVAELANEVAEFAKTDVTEHGIRLRLEIAPGLPPVRADRIHIQQVLMNLVRNAVDAISEYPEGERVITIAASRRGDRVEFDVHDTGPGIDPGIAARLFQPFTTTKDRGMGLGLSISRTIVQAHGGQLRYVQCEKPGATFRFDLPLAEEEQP
jgi:two-component system sensor kinase FixL